MQDQYEHLSGPDFLEAVADVELGNGNEVNADIYRQRARQWQRLESEHEQLQQQHASMQRALAPARRPTTPSHIEIGCGAITPSARIP